MVTIDIVGTYITVNISDEVPTCLIIAVKEIVEQAATRAYGMKVGSELRQHIEQEINREVTHFLANATHRDGYPTLLHILRKLKVHNE